MNNKLPYTVNWSFDLQYQLSNSWLFSVGYVGNHGTHEILPIPFNQPHIATASNPVNGQTSSYGLNQVAERNGFDQRIRGQRAGSRSLPRLRHEFGAV